MKKLFSLFALLLTLTLILSACSVDSPAAQTEIDTPSQKTEFKIPDNIITETEYREKVDALLCGSNFQTMDKSYTDNLDTLRKDLYNLIMYNQDTPEYTGTAYYISNSGDDSNDGLTPETAWATLDKASHTVFKEGDAVLFERGGFWRGNLFVQNGITYAAYGTGPKPKIYNSIDGKKYEWVKTEYPNVWVTTRGLGLDDVGNVVFNDNRCGAFVETFTSLKANYKYLYAGPFQTKVPSTKKLYIYCDEGNPSEVYDEIEISIPSSVAVFQNDVKENITFHSLELSFGQDYFYGGPLNNIRASYCSFRFSGGSRTLNDGVRMGGGGGTGGNCDGLYFEHCYIFEQFDAGVTTQATGSHVSVFKNFLATDCLIENTEYPYEYFQHVEGEENIKNSRYENIYFAYNLCFNTGGGFGDKRARSACIVGNSDKQEAINCIIEKNIFDRSQKLSIKMSAYDLNGNFSTNNLFTLKNNLYVISNTAEDFATVNGVSYKADLEGFNKYVADAYEQNPVMRIIP